MQNQLMCKPLGGASVGYHQVRLSYANHNDFFLDRLVWHRRGDRHDILFYLGIVAMRGRLMVKEKTELGRAITLRLTQSEYAEYVRLGGVKFLRLFLRTSAGIQKEIKEAKK